MQSSQILTYDTERMKKIKEINLIFTRMLTVHFVIFFLKLMSYLTQFIYSKEKGLWKAEEQACAFMRIALKIKSTHTISLPQ